MKYQMLSLQLWIIAAICIAWSHAAEVPQVAGSSMDEVDDQGTAALLKEYAAHDGITSEETNTVDGFQVSGQRSLYSETESGVTESDDMVVATGSEVWKSDDINVDVDVLGQYRYTKEEELVCRCKPRRRRYSVFLDCKDAHAKGRKKSGVYTIRPDKKGPAFKAYCDMTTDGGGWTVFQRRRDGSVNFYRGWNEYVKGFGNLEGEFFLGLEKLNRLAKDSNSQLRVDMKDWDGAAAYAQYSTFGIGNSDTKYTLTVLDYSGNAGDSLVSHNGMKFSTFDQDNDNNGGNCAVQYKGAYWYNACHTSNINGAYLGNNSNRGVTSSYADGVVWYHWKGYYYSLKYTVMMARRM